MDSGQKTSKDHPQQHRHDTDDDDDDYDDYEDYEDYEDDLKDTRTVKPEDFIKEVFESDLKAARNLSLKLRDVGCDGDKKKQKESDLDIYKKRETDAFIHDRAGNWIEETREGRNFLHYLAEYNLKDHENPVSLQLLMRQSIRKLPVDSVWLRDNNNHFPLTTALLKGNAPFYYTFCIRRKKDVYQEYQAFLLSKYDNGVVRKETTFVHVAVACAFDNGKNRADAFNSMCRFTPRAMFLVKDNKGRTPLHLAVEYEFSCKTQVDVVNDLLRSCPELSDIPIKDPDDSNRHLSVYQYHHHIRKKMLESRPRHAQDLVSQDLKGGVPKRFESKQEKGLDPKKDSRRVVPKAEKSSSEKTSMGPPPAREKGDAGSKRRGSIAMTPQGATTPDQSPFLAPVSRIKTELVANLTRPVVFEKAVNKRKEIDEAANRISDLLKQEILRRESPGKASESLRLQDEPVKNLWFDFGLPKTVSEDVFKRHFGHLQFDEALQYVAFPEVGPNDSLEQPDMRHQGRKDMVFFFNWLRGKSVKRIFKVVVEDMKKPSHSDEAIEDCLKDLGVETLDWRRLDLDAICLRNIGAHLREVHLQWSGSNSTLRAWSEKEGLAMIPTLEVIHLSQHEGLESRQRTLDNIKTFEERLHKSWPEGKVPPRVIPPRTGGGRRVAQVPIPNATPQPPEHSVNPHKWIECMEGFSKHFRQIQALRDKTPFQKPVEVALIDDGVNFMHPDLGGSKSGIFDGKSFDYRDDGSTPRVPPYWSSSSGHGTLMARLIRKICPSAAIYVIKLRTFNVENSNKLQIRTESAIKAIEFAAERGSQIICMSWTIKPPEGVLKKQFDLAILNAINDHEVLIFCAASDQGQFADSTYPHSSNRQCFRIGAATRTGTILDAVGDPDSVNFILPGHEVVVNTKDLEAQLKTLEAHSGSSVANGLATGLAALIIECVRLGATYTKELKDLDPNIAVKFNWSSISEKDLKTIRKPDQMKYALSSIGTDSNTKHKYIAVWKTFSKAAEKLSHTNDRLEELEIIAELARSFLQGAVQ